MMITQDTKQAINNALSHFKKGLKELDGIKYTDCLILDTKIFEPNHMYSFISILGILEIMINYLDDYSSRYKGGE